MLNEQKFGYIPSAYYLYRRGEHDSLIKSSYKYEVREYMYRDFISFVLKHLVELSIEKYGYVLLNLQKKIIRMIIHICLDVVPIEIYKHKFFEDSYNILKYIEEKTILNISLNDIEKEFLLKFKYKLLLNQSNKVNEKFLIETEISPEYNMFDNVYIEFKVIQFEKFTNDDNNILGIRFYFIVKKDQIINNIFVKIGELCYLAEINQIENISIFGKELYCKYIFSLKLDYCKHYNEVIELYIDIDNKKILYPHTIKIT